MVLILKIEAVLILNKFDIVFNRQTFGTKQSGLKMEMVLILRWSLSDVSLYIGTCTYDKCQDNAQKPNVISVECE